MNISRRRFMEGAAALAASRRLRALAALETPAAAAPPAIIPGLAKMGEQALLSIAVQSDPLKIYPAETRAPIRGPFTSAPSEQGELLKSFAHHQSTCKIYGHFLTLGGDAGAVAASVKKQIEDLPRRQKGDRAAKQRRMLENFESMVSGLHSPEVVAAKINELEQDVLGKLNAAAERAGKDFITGRMGLEHLFVFGSGRRFRLCDDFATTPIKFHMDYNPLRAVENPFAALTFTVEDLRLITAITHLLDNGARFYDEGLDAEGEAVLSSLQQSFLGRYTAAYKRDPRQDLFNRAAPKGQEFVAPTGEDIPARLTNGMVADLVAAGEKYHPHNPDGAQTIDHILAAPDFRDSMDFAAFMWNEKMQAHLKHMDDHRYGYVLKETSVYYDPRMKRHPHATQSAPAENLLVQSLGRATANLAARAGKAAERMVLENTVARVADITAPPALPAPGEAPLRPDFAAVETEAKQPAMA